MQKKKKKKKKKSFTPLRNFSSIIYIWNLEVMENEQEWRIMVG